MIKKCMGCGVVLQSDNKEEIGYTPDTKNNYCMRCFRLKNYGEIKNNEVIDEKEILRVVNKSKGLAFFFIDYLNICKYTMDIFKKIKINKILVINKIDVLRKDMKFLKIKKWLQKEYDINDEIIFLSNKTGFGTSAVMDYIERSSYEPIYIMGITNAGKSTFINHLLKEYKINKEIVTSKKPNTTLDFIKFRINNITIFDTPGFTYPNMSSELINSRIKPVTYQIKKDSSIIIGSYQITFLFPTSVTLYLSTSNFKRVYKGGLGEEYKLKENQDIVLPGLGFINVKQKGTVIINNNDIELRLSISEVNYE